MIRFSTVFIFIILIGLALLVYMHEEVHVIIYDTYGIDSEIGIDFPHAYTKPIGNYSECNDSCELAHNINEAVTYPLLSFYLLISFGFYIVIILQELQYDL